MSLIEYRSELTATNIILERDIRIVMLQLGEARLNGDKEGAAALRAELADLFAERDRKAHALTVLNNHLAKENHEGV